MDISIELTENDINIINIAYERKIKQDGNILKKYKFTCYPHVEDLEAHDEFQLTKTMLECYKHGSTGVINDEKLSPVHGIQYEILHADLKLCEETCYEKILEVKFTRMDLAEIDSIKSLKQFLCFENYMHLTNGGLKETLEQIGSTRILSFIVDLLMDYHCGHECRLFISIAIKLCVKALELSEYTSSETVENVHETFKNYFMIIHSNRCEEHISAYILKNFYASYEMKTLLLEIQNLRCIFEDVLKTGTSIQNFLNHNRPGVISLLDCCLLNNSHNFVALTEFGSFSKYSKLDWNILRLNYSWLYSWTNLRTLQIFHLHTLPVREGTYLLKLLWAVIPEPFLMENEFKSSACRFASVSASTERTERELKLAWIWYKRTILKGNYIKSPRCLVHLSRCAIRQNMAENYLISKVIPSFNIPNELISYLLLKDCGNNPYDDKE